MSKQPETGWLLEIQIGGRAVWWRARVECGRAWTTDANEAVRFARKDDALRVRDGMRYTLDNFDWSKAEATEHMWSPLLGELTHIPDGKCFHCGTDTDWPTDKVCGVRADTGHCLFPEKKR